MPQFLVSVIHPEGFVPNLEDEGLHRDVSALNQEMITAGVRNFACGLSRPTQSKLLRAQPDGEILITDGPFLESKEFTGGFWILETADMEEAMAWARKAVVACRTPVEVRSIFFKPQQPEANGQPGKLAPG